jgi:hypothetical protein
MSDCNVCLIGPEEFCEFFDESIRIARKPHRCSECGAAISVGAKYHSASGKSDGEFWRINTCLLCSEIRKAFSCDGEVLGGMLWEDMQENIFPRMSATCFDRLRTPEAKAELQSRWMEWKGLAA